MENNQEVLNIRPDDGSEICGKLESLINSYQFSPVALSPYLGLPADAIEHLASGDIAFLPKEPVFNCIIKSFFCS